MSHLKRLRDAGIETPERDLSLLKRAFEGDAFELALQKRLERQPMSQILGYRDFWKDRFVVNADVLDPRPDSELFIEVAVDWGQKFSRILDLGTGSGALGLSALREFEKATALLVDQSSGAIKVAEHNIEGLGLEERASTVQSDWFSNVNGQFDLILCNPPYLTEGEYQASQAELHFEPKDALTDGGNGLQHYRVLSKQLGSYLSENGIALFEHGYEQQDRVEEIFKLMGFQTKKFTDLSRNPRLVAVFLQKDEKKPTK